MAKTKGSKAKGPMSQNAARKAGAPANGGKRGVKLPARGGGGGDA